MRRTPATTVAIIALAAAAPTVGAMDVEDKDLKLSLILNLQARAEVSRASDAAGGDYDIATGTSGEPDTADFYLRRFRPGFKGVYQDHWKFAAILRADESDRTFNSGATAASQNRVVSVHQGYVGREFASGDVTHYVQLGMDYAFFNHANSSNSTALMPAQRASQALLPVRGTGAAYRVSAPIFRFGVDVQNNTGDSSASNGDESEGLCYTARLELTGPGDLALKRFQETYFNQAGTGFIVGLEAGTNRDDRNAAGTSSTTITAYGVDAVFHHRGVNALAEIRRARIEVEPDAGGGTDTDQQVMLAQLGYAFPAGEVVLEPAIRYSRIDLDTDNDDETAPFGTADFGASGDQVELGVTCYFNGHGNKLQLAYTHWSAEAGDADADIVRLQHQLNF
jgi:hypothetical protein